MFDPTLLDPAEDPFASRHRLQTATSLVLLVLVSGSVGYYILGGGEWSLLDCVFMTVITLTTVGYGETIPVSHNPQAMIFTLLLLIMGMGVILYFVSSLTAFIIDGDLHHYIRKKRMDKQIKKLKDHHIVCGLRGPGEHVLRELIENKAPMVLIEKKPQYVANLKQLMGVEVPYVLGDATDDDILERAGIHKCQAMIVTLGNDRDNLFCTITARTLNPQMRIITQGEDPRSEQKYKRAGADKVIFTTVISGQRMASEVLRPNVLTYLDLVIRDKSHPLRIEEIHIGSNSSVQDKTLREADLRRKTDVLVIAVYDTTTQHHTYNPTPDFVIKDGHILLILGRPHEIEMLRKQIS